MNTYKIEDPRDPSKKQRWFYDAREVASQLMSLLIVDDNGDVTAESVQDAIKGIWIMIHGPLLAGSSSEKKLDELAKDIMNVEER